MGNSPFIEGSKDDQYSAKVSDHFNGVAGPGQPGGSSGNYKRKYDNKDSSAEFFNNETGVNYKHNGAKGSYPRG